MKKILVVLVVLVVALAYAAGYWPARQQLADAQDQIRGLQDHTTFVEGRLRVSDLLGSALRLSEAAAARNYGEAAALSSPFFDAVGREAALTDQPVVRAALDTILKTRDQLTTAIAQSDPSLTDMLKDYERTLRQALGYSVSPAV